MNKELNNKTYQAFNGLVSTRFELNASFNLKYKACSLTGMGFFSLHKEHIQLKTILGGLIISNLKQKLPITLNDLINPISCAVLRLTTGTCIIIYLGLIIGACRGAI